MESLYLLTIFFNLCFSMVMLSLVQRSIFLVFWIFFQFFVYSFLLNSLFISIAVIFTTVTMMLILFFFQKNEIIITDEGQEAPNTQAIMKKHISLFCICCGVSLITVIKNKCFWTQVTGWDEKYAESRVDLWGDGNDYFLLAVISILLLLVSIESQGVLKNNFTLRGITHRD